MIFLSRLPSKSRCLRELRKVYPGADVELLPSGALQLTYSFNGTRAPVLEITPAQAKIGMGQLMLSLVKVAFRRFGFETTYKPGFPSGKFTMTPIEGYAGPESLAPVEFDTPEACAEGNEP